MANWSDIALSPGDLDYIDRLNALRTRAEASSTEVEAARGSEATLSARLALLVPGNGMTANLNAAGWRITGLGDPVNSQDAATRSWVAAQVVGGGAPGDIPITSLNVGTLVDGDLVIRNGAGIGGRSLSAVSLAELGAAGVPDGYVATSLAEGVVFQQLGAAAVGLANVDNTADADKPVSNAAQAALDGKADLGGAAFTTDQVTLAGELAGFRGVPLAAITSAYTFSLADAGKGVCKSVTANITVTIPTNATVAFPLGTILTVVSNASSGNLSVSGAAGVTLRLAGATTTGTRSIAPWGYATALQVATNVWLVAGPGVT